MKTKLMIAMHILSLMLITTSIFLPLVAIRHAIAFPYIKKVSPLWTDYPIPWDVWSVTYYYFSDPIFTLPSLFALGAGLWLLLSPLSWKNGLTALVSAVPLSCLMIIVCDSMLRKIPLF